MPDSPYKPLLHRELAKFDVTKHCMPQLELLKDLVNYGSNMIPACLHSSEKQLRDIIVVAVLLRQVVLNLDSFEVLIGESCTESAMLQVRAIFEASLQLDWILEGDSPLKAKYYYVASVRRKLLWAKRTVAETEESKKFFDQLGQFAEDLDPYRQRMEEEAMIQIRRIERFLGKQEFTEINKHFDSVKKSAPFDPFWYKPLGQKSLRSISKAVGRSAEYEVFYGQLSQASHASDYGHHIEIGSGKVTLREIRHLRQVKWLLQFAVCASLKTYRKVP
ncbi:MAG: DUF5677 domain-containing protein, partial [Pseudomonadota bacterium]